MIAVLGVPLSKFLDGLFFPKVWKDGTRVVDVPQDIEFAGPGVTVATESSRTKVTVANATPGGAGDANKIAAANSGGTGLQYAAGLFLDAAGAALGFGSTRANSGEIRGGTAFSIKGLISSTTRIILNYAGGVVEVGDPSGNGTFVHGPIQILQGGGLRWLFDQIATNTARLRCFFGSDNQAFINPEPNGDATSTVRRQFIMTGQDKTGNTSTVGGTLWFRAGDSQGSAGTHVGGLFKAVGGSATGGSGTRTGGDAWIGGGTGASRAGNVFIGVDGSFDPDSFNWQSMGGGIYLRNASAVPSGNPSSGGFLYVESGALKYRGSSGTVTTIGPA